MVFFCFGDPTQVIAHEYVGKHPQALGLAAVSQAFQNNVAICGTGEYIHPAYYGASEVVESLLIEYAVT
jgi:hypothetical protein